MLVDKEALEKNKAELVRMLKEYTKAHPTKAKTKIVEARDKGIIDEDLYKDIMHSYSFWARPSQKEIDVKALLKEYSTILMNLGRGWGKSWFASHLCLKLAEVPNTVIAYWGPDSGSL